LTPARIDAFLHGLLREKGQGTAKVSRSVVSGVCGLAVRRDGLRSNPVRDVRDLERGDRDGARALTSEECRHWLAVLDADRYAVRKDLPDLVRLLLGTGVRIGEAIGSPGTALIWIGGWCTSGAPLSRSGCGAGGEADEESSRSAGVASA
jgi:hypothetical protein